MGAILNYIMKIPVEVVIIVIILMLILVKITLSTIKGTFGLVVKIFTTIVICLGVLYLFYLLQ